MTIKLIVKSTNKIAAPSFTIEQIPFDADNLKRGVEGNWQTIKGSQTFNDSIIEGNSLELAFNGKAIKSTLYVIKVEKDGKGLFEEEGRAGTIPNTNPPLKNHIRHEKSIAVS